MAIEDGHLHSPGVRDSREKSVAVARGRKMSLGLDRHSVQTQWTRRVETDGVITKTEGRGAVIGQLVM